MSVDRKKRSQDSFSLLNAAKGNLWQRSDPPRAEGVFFATLHCVAADVERCMYIYREGINGVWRNRRKLIAISPSPIGGKSWCVIGTDRSALVCVFHCCSILHQSFGEEKRFISSDAIKCVLELSRCPSHHQHQAPDFYSLLPHCVEDDWILFVSSNSTHALTRLHTSSF